MSPDDGCQPPAPDVLDAVRQLVTGLLQEPAARLHLRRFAEQLIGVIDRAEASASTGPVASPVAVPPPSDAADVVFAEVEEPAVAAAVAAEPPSSVLSSEEALRQLKWAQSSDSRLSPAELEGLAGRVESTSEATGRPVTWRNVQDEELEIIPARCRLKAEACSWKLERRRRLEAGRRFAEEVQPIDAALITRAKQLPECFLWMNYQEEPEMGGALAWELLADSFEMLALAIEVIQEAGTIATDVPELYREALQLLAEAQSALRSAARGVGYDDEPEQDRTYNWLKRTAAERGQYIERFMRVDDPADPTQTADRRRRLIEFRERLETRKTQDRQRKKRLGQVKYLATQIREAPEADHDYNWQKLVTAVDELVAAGEPPSSKEIRRHLQPIFDDFPPGDLPGGVELVLREIDRFIGDHPDEEPPLAESKSSPVVTEVARRLAGRTMVLIGGVRKPGHVAALKEAFQLKDVVWVPTREHQSVTKFEPYVRQPDVAVVVLAIRWTSHSYGEVKDYCDAYGKPFVRLKAGYNPVQVATHILEQVSDALPVGAAHSESA